MSDSSYLLVDQKVLPDVFAKGYGSHNDVRCQNELDADSLVKQIRLATIE